MGSIVLVCLSGCRLPLQSLGSDRTPLSNGVCTCAHTVWLVVKQFNCYAQAFMVFDQSCFNVSMLLKVLDVLMYRAYIVQYCGAAGAFMFAV